MPAMSSYVSLRDNYLIAMPGLADTTFERALTYVCQHDEDGAMGLVVNRPGQMRLRELFKQLDLTVPGELLDEQVLLKGGPVSPERGFVLHRGGGDWDATTSITEDIHLTHSRDVLAAISSGHGPTQFLVALGYAGWSAGQLEQELAQNAWLNVPADADVMFSHPPEARLDAAAGLLGIQLDQLGSDVGHA